MIFYPFSPPSAKKLAHLTDYFFLTNHKKRSTIMLSLPMMNKIVVRPVFYLAVYCYFAKGHMGREKFVTLFSNGS